MAAVPGRGAARPHRGFYWAARTAGIISGFDCYVGGQCQMRWRLLGLVPVVRAVGPDISRSAAGRMVGEAMWVPTALLPRFGVDWSAADDHHLSARWPINTHEAALELVINDRGRLREGVFQRWGDPRPDRHLRAAPVRGRGDRLCHLRRVTVPSEGRAGWFYGTDRWAEGEFFRYQLTSAELLTRSAS